MSDFFNNLKTLVLGTKTSGIDRDIDSSMQSIDSLSSKLSTNKYLETIKSLITQTGIDPTSDILKNLQSSQQAQNIQVYDQTGRISRYAEYDSIINKISYCQRALVTLVDHILSPDEITKKSLVFTLDQTSDKNTSSTVLARCKEIERKLLMENKLNKIINNTLKKGDYFTEILHSPRGQNALTILHENKELESSDFKDLHQSDPILINEKVTRDEADELFQRKIILEYAPFGGPFTGMGSNTWGANTTGDGVGGRAITYKKDNNPVTKSKDNNPVKGHDDEDPDFESKYSKNKIKDLETKGFRLKDIFLTPHNPKFVIRLETERFRSCLGFLIFPKVDPATMAASSSLTFGANNIDSICMSIVNKLHDTLKSSNDKIVLSQDLKDTVINYLKVLKNNEDLKIRYVPPELMIHWRLNTDRYDPYGESIFDCVNFDCRLLIALKTANTVKKLTSATDKRVVYVETGLPREAKNIIEAMKENLNKKKVSIASMGSIDTIPSQINTFETTFIPMRDGKKFIEMEKQEWGQDANQDTEMLKFIRDNIVANMAVPAPYLGLEENVCLSFNEKIPLLDGFNISLGKLVEEYEKDPINFNHWTFSVNENNDIVAGKILSAKRTRKNAKMIKVWIDNGKGIEVTPDHLFMMRDGTYKEAQYLQPEDSLMPWYIKKTGYKTRNNTPYMTIYHPGKGKWQSIYRMVAESLERVKRNDGMTVHHINEDPLNNHPDNLLVCSRDKHLKIHNKKYRYNSKNQDTYSIFETRTCIICQKDFKCKIQCNQITCLSESCKKERRRLDGLKSWERRKNLFKDDYKIVKVKCSVCEKEFETYQKYLNIRTEKWITCGNYKCGRIITGKRKTFNIYGDQSSLKLKCVICNKEFDISVRQEHKSNTCSIRCMNTLLARRRFRGNRQLSHCFVCGKDIYPTETHRKMNRYIPCSDNYCKSLKQGVEIWLRNNQDMTVQDYIELKSQSIFLNHKVVKVEWLTDVQDCCDLEIEKYHNFALSSGVFVHNSNRSLLSTENINFCRTIISYQKELSIFLKETFEKIYVLIFPGESLEIFEKIKITFQEPKISPYEHEMEYVETMQRLIEALKALDVPMSWLKKKYLPTIDWDEVEKFKAEETINTELSETPPDQNMAGGGGLY